MTENSVPVVVPPLADVPTATARALDLLATYTRETLQEMAIDSMLGDYSDTEVLARELAHVLDTLGGIEKRADKRVRLVTETGEGI